MMLDPVLPARLGFFACPNGFAEVQKNWHIRLLAKGFEGNILTVSNFQPLRALRIISTTKADGVEEKYS